MAINLAQFSKSGTGFGQGAYNRARAAGLSDAQIKAALPSAGLTIGSSVGQSLGGSTNLYQHRGGGGQFGLTSYNNAIAAGLTPGQIRSSLAASGLRIGDKAAQALNVNQGMTYLGYSPGTQASFKGNSGLEYPARPILAPRGYGLNNSTFSSDRGYSPTFYVSGGTNDFDAVNFLFGTNYQGGPNVGTGYSDPTFNEVNAGTPSAAMRIANTGVDFKVPEFDFKLPEFDFSMPAFNYSIPGGSSKSSVSGVRSAVSSRNRTSGSLGRSTPGGMQIKSLNV
jgi:hypothetical protein